MSCRRCSNWARRGRTSCGPEHSSRCGRCGRLSQRCRGISRSRADVIVAGSSAALAPLQRATVLQILLSALPTRLAAATSITLAGRAATLPVSAYSMLDSPGSGSIFSSK